MENLDIYKKTAKEFVKFINKNWKQSPDECRELIIRYFNATLKDGYMFVSCKPKLKERILEKSANKICGVKVIETPFELQEFLQFENRDFLKLIKPYTMDFLENFIRNYYIETIPTRTEIRGEYVQINSPQPYAENMFLMLDFVLKNSHYFFDNDVEKLSNAFLEAITARTQSQPAEKYQKLKIKGNVYDKMQGMYYFDAEILYNLSKGLVMRGLSVDNIKKVLGLGFEEDLGKAGYQAIDKQIGMFEDFCSGAQYVVNNPDEYRQARKFAKKQKNIEMEK